MFFYALALPSDLTDYFKVFLFTYNAFHPVHATIFCHKFHKSLKEIVLLFKVLTYSLAGFFHILTALFSHV